MAGGSFCALLVLSFYEYARSLPVTAGNWFFWNLGYPPLAIQALANTIAGSGHKLLAIAAVLVPGITIVWSVAASLGRTATLRELMPSREVRFRTMLALHLFRSAVALAALIGFAGVFAIAMRLYSDGPGTVPHPQRATWTLLLGWILVAYLWSVLNWFLSVAPVVAVEQNRDALTAAGATVTTFGARSGCFLRINAVFGGLHVLTFLVFAGVSFFPVLIAASISGIAFLFVSGMITLAYLAIVDFLYVARLGAYASLVASTD